MDPKLKLLALFLALLSGGALGWIALRAEDPSYVAPEEEVMPESVPVALSGDVPAGSVVRRFDVEGMCCDGCSGKLYARVAERPEVREVAVDPILGTVALVVDAGADPEALADALTFDKYSVRAVE